ncbi:hypothetical protein [Agromyces archimandritae]|uniref:DUF2892 domain-containing protein n=1 Tax=Agromyces archimandritae TaxID=2781962 RepID=A0A975IN90_9MICO|nr:hypothetical protein [Agromyces archimandritae]QTX04372.1 hypothetical protein G127AT_14030 [Agromyces archimandritae]
MTGSPSAAPVCRPGAGTRIVQGLVALMVAAFAVGEVPEQPVIAIIAGVVALGVTAMAITGRCTIPVRAERIDEEAIAEYDDARRLVDLSAASQKDRT